MFQSALEAQFLVNQVQLYYGGGDEAKLALVDKFNLTPEDFKHMDLIEQLEKIDLTTRTQVDSTLTDPSDP